MLTGRFPLSVLQLTVVTDPTSRSHKALRWFLLLPFLRKAAALPVKSSLVAEVLVRPDDSPLRLNGSGMLVLNPPWKLDQSLAQALPVLASLMGEDAYRAVTRDVTPIATRILSAASASSRPETTRFCAVSTDLLSHECSRASPSWNGA